MKKLILFLILILGSVVIFAQDIPAPPDSWGDIIMNPQKWFLSFGAVSLLTAFLSTFFIGLLKVTKNFVKQLIAWVVAILLIVVSDLLNFGYAAEFPIVLAVIHGFGAGLASNGVFDIPVIKGVLDTIEKWFNPKA